MIGPGGRLAAGVIQASAVVIAAGGLGQAFATTSNPPGATGDGIAIAARAGAVLRDLEFVQFHPTVLWLPGASGQCPLITEALRGAGAVLRDLDGTPLMAGHDPRGDLAPRDVVAARMAEVIGAGNAGHVWLDATGIGADVLETGFPTVLAACRKHGIDPVTDFIPVAPGAHYSCGGILADLDGQTSIPGLYAVGEAASTGVQGANRLASNSVTEAIIAGRRAGRVIATRAAQASSRIAASSRPTGAHRRRRGRMPIADAQVGDPRRGLGSSARWQRRSGCIGGNASAPDGDDLERRAAGLRSAMSRWAGVMRDREGLTELARVISADGRRGYRRRGARHRIRGRRDGWGEAASVPSADLDFDLGLEAVEAANLRLVSGLIAAGGAAAGGEPGVPPAAGRGRDGGAAVAHADALGRAGVSW